MNKKIQQVLRISLAVFAIFSLMPTALAQEPQPNLDLYKQSLIRYHDSGEYAKDLAIVEKQAEDYLQTRVAANARLAKPKKLAIVFDIDETVLSNYPILKKKDFAHTLDTIRANQPKGTDPVIPEMYKLYQVAIKNNVAVFFVTGRLEKLKDATVQNLQRVGYTQWAGLVLKPNHYKGNSASVYKTAVREQIESKGYDIIMNIGDQKSDLVGGHADKTFKLPNPYYFVP